LLLEPEDLLNVAEQRAEGDNRGQFLTTWFAPGVSLPLEGIFTHSFTPRGEHSLLFRRIVERTENLPPGDNFTPLGQSSFLGDNFAPGGRSSPLEMKLRMDWDR
jgi:hypothetical protein